MVFLKSESSSDARGLLCSLKMVSRDSLCGAQWADMNTLRRLELDRLLILVKSNLCHLFQGESV